MSAFHNSAKFTEEKPNTQVSTLKVVSVSSILPQFSKLRNFMF